MSILKGKHVTAEPHARCARPVRIEIRPLRDGEEHLVREVFARLSGQARFLRFHSPTPRITEGILRGLVRAQHGRRAALIAFADGRPVGHALWAREAEHSRRAEVAVAVADDFQGRGLGQALVRHTARQVLPLGVTELTCHVHFDNARVRRLLTALGGHLAKDGVWVLPTRGLVQPVEARPDMLRWTDAVPRPRTPASADRRRH